LAWQGSASSSLLRKQQDSVRQGLVLIHDPVDWVRFLVRPSSIVLTLMRMV